MQKKSLSSRMIAIVLLCGLLFSPPIIFLFDTPSNLGLSRLTIWIFAAWLGIITIAAYFLETSDE
ncbi:hypothetical protein [Nitrincola tibetensis]|uniref:hypothetical protein n=1 Tax=Nitrincola tibetensis TaxID=2219697 RepID=UPI001057DEE1|nr:hypothetical protein [Nitrincola tibetensis]